MFYTTKNPLRHFHISETWNVKEPIYIVCWHINIIIDRISTPALCYLFMGQVLLVWPANKKKIKYWSNSFCLLIHLASSLLLYEDKRSSGTVFPPNLCEVTTVKVTRNSSVTNQVHNSQIKHCFWSRDTILWTKLKKTLPSWWQRPHFLFFVAPLFAGADLPVLNVLLAADDAGVSPHSKKSQPCPLGLAQQ